MALVPQQLSRPVLTHLIDQALNGDAVLGSNSLCRAHAHVGCGGNTGCAEYTGSCVFGGGSPECLKFAWLFGSINLLFDPAKVRLNVVEELHIRVLDPQIQLFRLYGYDDIFRIELDRHTKVIDVVIDCAVWRVRKGYSLNTVRQSEKLGKEPCNQGGTDFG